MPINEVEELKKEVKGIQNTVDLLTSKGGMVDKVNQIYDYLLGDGTFEKSGAKEKVDTIWKEYQSWVEIKPTVMTLVEERKALKIWKQYSVEINFIMSTISMALVLYITLTGLK